ncbi:MAG: amidase family protein, partial [Stellaceae bacterium]
MQRDEIAYLSAAALGEHYRDKTLSPVEVAKALLDRLDALEPKLNAFTIVDRDGALAVAAASEQRWRQGAALGPLDGVPATIKDLVLMRGFPTRRGSRLLADTPPDREDGPATARLKEAGAVILGKTTTPEFGWKGVT